MEPCGLTDAEAAMGVLAIAEAHMVNAIKLISVQRGLDPREFTLVGFGGAGPLHTLRLAEELGMSKALIPPAPGNLSALGMLAAEVRHDLVRTRLSLLDAIDPSVLASDFDEMLAVGAQALAMEEISEGATRFVMTVDLRYRGQNYDLNLPLPAGDMATSLRTLPTRFHERHRAIFGYDNPEKPIQLVNLRLAATGPSPKLPWPTVLRIKGPPKVVERRRVQVDAATNSELPVYRLTDLGADQVIDEPAIVRIPRLDLVHPTRLDRPRRRMPDPAPFPKPRRSALSDVLEQASRIDPVTIEIVRNALTAIAERNTTRMIRASTSIIVKEMEDCSAAVFDGLGRLLSESATIPIHLNCTGICLRTILDGYIPAADWKPGDIVATNDPYAGEGSLSTAHTNDYVIFMPVFFEGGLVGFTGLMVHHLEIGAMHMGTRGWNTEIWQEGVRVPPMRIGQDGSLNPDILRILLNNTRLPENMENDLRSQCASVRAAGEELVALFGRYGVKTLGGCFDALIDYSERRTRAEIAAIPDGVYRHEEQILDDGAAGGPYWLRLAIKNREATSRSTSPGPTPRSGGRLTRRSPQPGQLSSTPCAASWIRPYPAPKDASGPSA